MCVCVARINKILEPTGNRLALMVFLDGCPSLPVIATMPLVKGNHKKMELTPPYCPFCGVKYSKEGE